MRTRLWIFGGLFALLGLAYIVFFTEWIRPEPIQIAFQARTSILQPRFGRPTRTNAGPVKFDLNGQNNTGQGQVKVDINGRTNVMVVVDSAKRARLPDWGEIEHAPGGVANVTFSLDSSYVLTGIRVQDRPADGSPPNVLWEVVGKSRPTSSLLYGRVPVGMQSKAGSGAEPLTPGAPYSLILEAGRRRGTNHFMTLPVAGTDG